MVAAAKDASCSSDSFHTEMPRGLRGMQEIILDTHELTAEAIVKCDSTLLRRAMMTDPLVTNMTDADAILRELLAAERDALPQVIELHQVLAPQRHPGALRRDERLPPEEVACICHSRLEPLLGADVHHLEDVSAVALIAGDYVTPSKGQYAGQLGPWARLVSAVGLEPRRLSVDGPSA